MSMENQTSQSTEKEKEDSEKKTGDEAWYKRQDVLVFLVGQVFFGIIAGAIFGLGAWKGWDADSGYTHNTSLTSYLRFLPEPSVNDSYSYMRGRVGIDASSRWYYWMNKPEFVTIWTTLFVWICYITHQVSLWIVIYLAQLHKANTAEPKYLTTLNKYNWISLAINVFFHMLHILQTHTTYDGLAPELTVTTPQSSAITLFIWLMVLEYSERGLIFYWPTGRNRGKWSRKLRLNLKPVYLVRKYHSYMFAWAAVHTVWYHPMENTYGHTMGFYHTWLFLLQGSLMYTKIHQNKWFRFFQELMVGIHGGLVALQTGGPQLNGTQLWPMFTFGAMFMVVFTWIFILDFWSKIHAGFRAIPLVVFLAIAVGAYSQIPDAQGRMFVRLQEVVRFPLIFYFGFAIAYIILYVFMLVDEKIHGSHGAPAEVSTTKKVIYITAFMFVYGLMVIVSTLMQICDFRVSMFIQMSVLIFTYVIGSAAGYILVKHIVPRRKIISHSGGSAGTRDKQPINEVMMSVDAGKAAAVVSVENGKRVVEVATVGGNKNVRETSHGELSAEGGEKDLTNVSSL